MTKPIASKDELQKKLAEVELYKNHGLINEAKDVCSQLLNQIDTKDNALYNAIRTIIDDLEEIEESAPHVAAKKQQNTDPADAASHRYDTGVGLMESGFYSEAIEELDFLAGNKNIPQGNLFTRIGECYLYIDNHYKAIEYFEKAQNAKDLGKGSKSIELLDRLALAYENIGDFPRAITSLKDIVKINPKFRNSQKRLKQLSQTAQQHGRFNALILNKKITGKDLEKATKLAKQKNKPVDDLLISDFGIEKTELGLSLSEYYNCPFVEFSELEVEAPPAALQGIKEHFFRANSCIPIREEKGMLLIATDNPFDMVKTDNVKMVLKSSKIKTAVAFREDIEKFIDYFYGRLNVEETEDDVFDQLELVEEKDEEDNLDYDEPSGAAEGVVVQMTNRIVEDGIRRGASDIHIESLPGKQGTIVRFRTDGECSQYKNIPYQYKRAIVSRIKILAKLDISERRLPQDGKIKFRTKTRKNIELRIATLPTASGFEDVVIRILADTKALPVEKMGFSEHNLSLMKNMLSMPYGLILVVGPTGSGKTTTLHAALNYVNRPEKKIWTVEDPVEIVQEGLRQVQVNTSITLTFNKVLKAFLRADPDIIMVGETRDEETAKTVIEASLTGHLVFTTLHTNSAPETVTRLLGMGIEPFSFADSLIGIIAQRLVKKLCPKCKDPYQPGRVEKGAIVDEYGNHPVAPLDISALEGITLYKPKGCGACGNSGYKGRFAIHEVLFADDKVKQLVEKISPVTEIRAQALESGMFTLKQDGIQKVLMGISDFSQVRAACIK